MPDTARVAAGLWLAVEPGVPSAEIKARTFRGTARQSECAFLAARRAPSTSGGTPDATDYGCARMHRVPCRRSIMRTLYRFKSVHPVTRRDGHVSDREPSRDRRWSNLAFHRISDRPPRRVARRRNKLFSMACFAGVFARANRKCNPTKHPHCHLAPEMDFPSC